MIGAVNHCLKELPPFYLGSCRVKELWPLVSRKQMYIYEWRCLLGSIKTLACMNLRLTCTKGRSLWFVEDNIRQKLRFLGTMAYQRCICDILTIHVFIPPANVLRRSIHSSIFLHFLWEQLLLNWWTDNDETLHSCIIRPRSVREGG